MILFTGFFLSFYLLFTGFTSVTTYFTYFIKGGIVEKRHSNILVGLAAEVGTPKKPVKPVILLSESVISRLKAVRRTGRQEEMRKGVKYGKI